MTKEKNEDNVSRSGARDRFNRPRRAKAGDVSDLPNLKLAFDDKDGMYRYWANDDDKGRLHTLTQQRDYEFVEDEKGNKVQRRVGTKEDGSPLYAYLVEMPQEWRDEDKMAKEARLKEQEQSIIEGTDDKGAVGKEGRYIPTWAKNKIEHGKPLE